MPTRLRVSATALLSLLLGCAKPTPAIDEAPSTPPTAGPAEGAEAAAELDGPEPTPKVSAITIRPLLHASMLLTHEGRQIYVDPWSKADLSGLPPADLILVTDVHGDHLDTEAIASLRQASTTLIVPAAVRDALQDKLKGELKGVSVEVINNGERREIAGLKVEAVAMYNLVRGPEDGGLFHDKGRGNGYVLTLGEERVYISGDTECTPEMRALEDIDLAFVCMNLPYTMPPSEAIPCIEAFKPAVVYPYHYRDSDPGEVVQALAEDPEIEVRLLPWYPEPKP